MNYLLLFLLSITTMISKEEQLSNASNGEVLQDLALYYLVREPTVKSEKVPVLILLHGMRSNEGDLFSLADKLPREMLIISARAPYEMEKGAYVWYEIDFSNNKRVVNMQQAEKSRMVLSQFIDQLLKKYPIDPAQVYLMGFSQGAIMSYSLALTTPQKVKGIVALSGRILEETKAKVAKEGVEKLCVFIGHGTGDQVISILEGKAAAQYCLGQKTKLVQKEYPMGHEINYAELADINTWLYGLIR